MTASHVCRKFVLVWTVAEAQPIQSAAGRLAPDIPASHPKKTCAELRNVGATTGHGGHEEAMMPLSEDWKTTDDAELLTHLGEVVPA